MKRILIMLITILMAGCTTFPQEQLDRLEESIESQNAALSRLEEDVARLELIEVPEPEREIIIERVEVPSEVTVIQYKLDGKIVVGAREHIRVEPPGLWMDGRIDTGATTSSIHASDITIFERDGARWVSFNMDHDGVDRELEAPVVRVRRVLQANSPVPEQRPSVNLFVTIGGVETEAEFTLINRSHMTYPVLVGRNIIKDLLVVDVAHDYLHEVETEEE